MTGQRGGAMDVAPLEDDRDSLAEAELVSRFVSRMRVDTWTAEVVTAFRQRQIRAVLLKGPAISRWLYAGEATTRSYDDADLLVSPQDIPRADEVLRNIGFKPRFGFEPPARGEPAKHARAWIRPSDRANVDLHRTLHGLESVDAERVWAEVISGVERCEVGGVVVDIPGPVMRTLHVFLHARAHQSPRSRSFEDLRRAIAQVDPRTWREAWELALRLGLEDEVADQLSTAASGAVLADDLGLPFVGSLRSYIADGIKRAEFPQSTYVLSSFAATTGFRNKAHFVMRRLFPSRRFMKMRYAIASKGVFGLTTAYGVRIVQAGTHLPGACCCWIRFQVHLRGIPQDQRPKAG